MHGTRSRVWTFLMLSVGSLAWATQSLAADPDEAGLHCRRALALKQARVFDGALAEAREALAARPDSAEAHWVMAWLEAEHGSAANAAREFQAVIRLAPDAVRATEAQQAIARLATRGVTIPAAAAPALPAVDDPPAPADQPEPAGTPPAAATAGEAAPPTTAEPQDGGDSAAAQSVADAAPPHEPADQPEPAGTPPAAGAPPTTAEPQDGGDSDAAQSVADAAPPHEPADHGATARVQRAVERALSSGVGTAPAREALQPLRQALPARPPLCVHPSTYARLRALGVRDDEMDGDGMTRAQGHTVRSAPSRGGPSGTASASRSASQGATGSTGRCRRDSWCSCAPSPTGTGSTCTSSVPHRCRPIADACPRACPSSTGNCTPGWRDATGSGGMGRWASTGCPRNSSARTSWQLPTARSSHPCREVSALVAGEGCRRR
jgi:tetratricopeptide (TPR) repeat protein